MTRESDSKLASSPASKQAPKSEDEGLDPRSISSAMFDGERASFASLAAPESDAVREEHAQFEMLRTEIRSWHRELALDSQTGRPYEVNLWSRLEADVERIAAEYRAGHAVAPKEVLGLRDRFAALLENIRSAVPAIGSLLAPRSNERSLGWGLAFGSACAAGLVLFVAQRQMPNDPGMTGTEQLASIGSSSEGRVASVAASGSQEAMQLAQNDIELPGVPPVPIAVHSSGQPGLDLVAFAQHLDRSPERRAIDSPGRQGGNGDWNASVRVRLVDPQLVAYQMSANDAMSLGTGVASGGTGGLRAGNVDIAWIRSANRFRLLTPRGSDENGRQELARANPESSSAGRESGPVPDTGATPNTGATPWRGTVVPMVSDDGGLSRSSIPVVRVSDTGSRRLMNGSANSSPVIWVARRGRATP